MSGIIGAGFGKVEGSSGCRGFITITRCEREEISHSLCRVLYLHRLTSTLIPIHRPRRMSPMSTHDTSPTYRQIVNPTRE